MQRFLYCVHVWVFLMDREYLPLYLFAILLQSDFHFHQHDLQVMPVGKHSWVGVSNQHVMSRQLYKPIIYCLNEWTLVPYSGVVNPAIRTNICVKALSHSGPAITKSIERLNVYAYSCKNTSHHYYVSWSVRVFHLLHRACG